MSADQLLTIPGFAGQTIAPGDPKYDQLRKVYNGAIDHRPALILRCRGAADVAAAFAART